MDDSTTLFLAGLVFTLIGTSILSLYYYAKGKKQAIEHTQTQEKNVEMTKTQSSQAEDSVTNDSFTIEIDNRKIGGNSGEIESEFPFPEFLIKSGEKMPNAQMPKNELPNLETLTPHVLTENVENVSEWINWCSSDAVWVLGVCFISIGVHYLVNSLLPERLTTPNQDGGETMQIGGRQVSFNETYHENRIVDGILRQVYSSPNMRLRQEVNVLMHKHKHGIPTLIDALSKKTGIKELSLMSNQTKEFSEPFVTVFIPGNPQNSKLPENTSNCTTSFQGQSHTVGGKQHISETQNDDLREKRVKEFMVNRRGNPEKRFSTPSTSPLDPPTLSSENPTP